MCGWKEIDSIFKSALERPAGAEREAFLDDACRGDDRLRDKPCPYSFAMVSQWRAKVFAPDKKGAGAALTS